MIPHAIAVQPLALAGVAAHDLERRHDERGWECFARHLPAVDANQSQQTLVVRTHCGVLRGTYAHPFTTAKLSLVEGSALLGMYDLRPASPTYGRGVTIDLGERHTLSAVRIPAGVAYALWFTSASVHAITSERVIATVDEYACRWDDPGLGFVWQPVDPVLSARDALAGSLNALRTSVAAALG